MKNRKRDGDVEDGANCKVCAKLRWGSRYVCCLTCVGAAERVGRYGLGRAQGVRSAQSEGLSLRLDELRWMNTVGEIKGTSKL